MPEKSNQSPGHAMKIVGVLMVCVSPTPFCTFMDGWIAGWIMAGLFFGGLALYMIGRLGDNY